VNDTPEGSYAKLHERLHGRGVPDVEQAVRDIQLAPLYAAFRDLVNGKTLSEIRAGETIAAEVETKAKAFAQVVREYGVANADENAFAARVAKNLESAEKISRPALPARASRELRAAADALARQLETDSMRDGLAAFAFVDALETFSDDAAETSHGAQAVARIDAWQLGRMLGEALRAAQVSDARIWQLIQLYKIALTHPQANSLATLLEDADAAAFLNVNEYEGVRWFNREQFEALVDWLAVVGAYRITRDEKSAAKQNAALVKQFAQWQSWRAAQAQSAYQVEKLLAALPKSKQSAPKAMAAKKAPAKKITTAKKIAAAKKIAPKTKTPAKKQTIKTTKAAPVKKIAPAAKKSAAKNSRAKKGKTSK
jgi:hypothetical protein